jgi:hypothetical protein
MGTITVGIELSEVNAQLPWMRAATVLRTLQLAGASSKYTLFSVPLAGRHTP